MNRKQQMNKKMAKRAKAKKNKVSQPNPSNKPVERYISKAERAKMEQAEQQPVEVAPAAEAETETETETETVDSETASETNS
ncbi:DUF2986 domain-containing protein [Shewanella maritima]|uniref:DUF2986 domain-containing protein n=1 Tax=Shewanella maritima TaxID=2520507 RepID=UPI0037352C1F